MRCALLWFPVGSRCCANPHLGGSGNTLTGTFCALMRSETPTGADPLRSRTAAGDLGLWFHPTS